MFNSDNGYSLADIAAVAGNGYGNGGFFGDNNGWWIILLFLFALGGWGNGGWGNNNSGFGGGIAPAMIGNDITYGLDMNDLHHGISDLATSTANGFYNINTSLLSGFANTNANVAAGTNAIQSDICDLALSGVQNTNAIQQSINANTIAGMQNTFGLTQTLAGMQSAQQLANCQTDQMISGALAQLNYNIATENCADRQAVADGVRDIMENCNNNTRSILDFLVQDRISALQNENAALKTQASQAEQNAYLLSQLRPVPAPAYLTANPYTGSIIPNGNGYWPTYGYGCGCGSNNLVG